MSVMPTRPAPLLHPGTYLEEWIEDNPVSQHELAAKLGCSNKHLSRVINGHNSISPDFACRLELTTGISAEFWLVHQAKFDARTKKITISQEDISTVKSLFPADCLAPLRKAGIITGSWRKAEDLVREIFQKFRVASTPGLKISLAQQTSVAYRQSTAYDVKNGALGSWLLLAENLAQESAYSLSEFSADLLRDKIPVLRDLTLKEPDSFVSEVSRELAKCGVGFVALKDIPGARVNGASFMQNGNPIICVTDRFHREDNFWFTLFHEIAHVLHDDISAPLIDTEEGVTSPKDDREKNANDWASAHLLNPEYHEALSQIHSKDAAEELAREAGVSVGIIIGRMHHLDLKDHRWGRDKIRTFKLPS
ncbi:HigA family addiction module antitoxin [Corynebacterium sp. A21]|uniref:HigA family addiction module antitoxin n=1 Tax=Corynebacterium sp. A21 TaxID=3457318 RepID=UPI003FD61B15